MIKKAVPAVIAALLVLFISGCDTLTGVMPSSGEINTPVPAAVSTPAPTMGALEPLDAAFCMESPPEAHQVVYSVLRFFPGGVVLHANVEGWDSCEATWDYISPYLNETATATFSHGEYQYSDGVIRFALAPAGSDEMAGTVNGRIDGDTMILQQQGTEMVYIKIYGGE
ncbi:MAG: hypothetical protein ACOX17_02185 [Christensenellales bacterium]